LKGRVGMGERPRAHAYTLVGGGLKRRLVPRRPSAGGRPEPLGPKLVRKIHTCAGETDTHILDEAARLLEEFLEGDHESLLRGVVRMGGKGSPLL